MRKAISIHCQHPKPLQPSLQVAEWVQEANSKADATTPPICSIHASKILKLEYAG